jgi:hypothetical protein
MGGWEEGKKGRREEGKTKGIRYRSGIGWDWDWVWQRSEEKG